MNKTDDIFSSRLKSLRLSMGLSQKSLGIQAEIDPSVASTRLNRYEQGVHNPDFSIVQKLAQVLNAPPSYFYTVDDNLARLNLAYHRATKKKQLEFLRFFSENLG
jgi:transcriptional regulator with XRE-family HTH domain